MHTECEQDATMDARERHQSVFSATGHLARPGEPNIIPSRPHPPVRAPMVLPRERVAAQCGQKSPELLVRLNLNRQVTAMPKCGQNIVKYRACAISSPSLQEPGMAVVHRNEPQTPSTSSDLQKQINVKRGRRHERSH